MLALLATACGSAAADTGAGIDQTDSSNTNNSAASNVPSQGGTNEDAFSTFLTALGDGDRELAATVATPEALGIDEWLGYDGLPNPAKPGHLTNAEGTLTGTTADYWLAPGRTLTCQLDDGVVVTCTPGE